MADDARLQIVLEAKIDKLTERLTEANRQVARSSKQMSQDLEEANSKWERLFLGEGPGKAIERVFSRSRLAVLEEGSAKIPVFGSALEALGPAGVGAAAGVAALGLAAEQVRKAMEFSSELVKTAHSLGVTTTALQEYDAAAIATGVGQDKAREGIASFNEVFGKYASGLSTPRQGKFLNALGFTPQDARGITDVSDALEKALLAIAKLPNGSQRASLAEAVGLTGFLPVIGQGTEGIEDFIAKMREARDSGEIISPAQIARAAELNEKVEALSHKIDQEFKQAFIDLAPEIEHVAEALERFASRVAHLLGQIPDAIRGIADLGRVFSGLPSIKLPDLGGLAARIPGTPQNLFHTVHEAFDDRVRQGRVAALRLPTDAAGSADLSSQLRSALRPDETSGRVVDLSRFNERPKRQRAAPEDQTASFNSQAQEAVDQASADLANAQKELTKNIEARADLEKQAVDASTDKRLAALAAQEAKIRASKVDTNKVSQLALLETTRSDVQAAAVAKKTLIDRQAQDAQLAADKAQRDIDASLRDRHTQAAGTLLTSASAKADLELDAFHARLTDALADFKAQQDQAVRDGSLAPAQRDANVADYRRQNQEDLVAERTRQQRSINPLYDRAHPTTSVADDLQGIEAKGLDGVTDSLTKFATGAVDAKTAFHDFVSSILADLVRLAVQREIEAPLANLLFGASSINNLGNLGASGGSVSVLPSVFSALFNPIKLASGGVVPGVGGPTQDNIPAMLSPGELVVSNSTLAGLRNLNPASLSRPSGGSPVIISIDAGGAFSYDHVVGLVESGVRRAAATSGMQIASVSRRQQVAAKQDTSRF